MDSSDSSERSATGWSVGAKLLLAVGYLGLAGAVLVAHGSPANGYELSIYEATPTGFWVGVGAALLVGLVVALSAAGPVLRGFATVLGGGAVVAIAGLPLLRGYAFYGTSDALTHLGWLKDVQAGQMGALDLYYPGLHSMGLLVSDVVGYTPARALLFAVLAFVLVYVAFVPLAVGSLSDHPDALVVGAFAGFLLLPINHVAINYMNPHPISEAVLFSPLVLFLLIRYLDVPASEGLVTKVGVLLAVALVATVVYHSMLAAALISFMGAIALVQFVQRRLTTDGGMLAARPVYGQTALLIVAFGLWNVRFDTVVRTAELMYLAIANVLAGGSQTGAVVVQRSGSLAGVGGSLFEVFAKLLLPSAVFAVLGAALVLYSFVRWRDVSLTRVRLLGVGLVGVGLYSVPFLFGNVSRLFFRNLGFVMAVTTVLGAVALLRVADFGMGMTPGLSTSRAAVLGVGFAALLVLSVLVVFPSPYIYHANEQVTERQFAGYETAFEHGDPGVAFAGIRTSPQRYVEAFYGNEEVPAGLARWGFYRREGAIPGANLTDIPGHVDVDRYLVVSEYDVQREIEAYNGLRYSADQLDAIDDQRGVGRVQSNGDLVVYYVNSTS